jgi:O-antigen/teichoic acid export membrane protein
MEKVDERALLSIIAGVAALIFSFAVDRWLFHTLSLVLGVVSVWSGVAVLREGRKGMGISVAGIVLGTIAVCSWLLAKTYSP